ncbi:antitoxin VbhA family protein [Bacillus daqingensis]|uniref:Antitoxin VbhA family protein n=1 Tax=Bacillus daqingensis TaxID=872396 RepID=A0ABV9NXP8_9BACI
MSRSNKEIKSAFQSARASLAVEGMTLSAKQEALVMDQLSGRMSEEAFVERALELSRHE